MSGGAFNHKDYHIRDIARQIEELIRDNDDRGEYAYSEETINQFREAMNLLFRADAMVHRIDWLVSGDDGEDTFHRRLREDLERLERE
jgi:hypothetical protein